MKNIYKQKLIESKRVVIKIGSARVSGEKSVVNDFLYHLAGSVRKLRDSGKKVVIVSSGAIARGKNLFSEIYPQIELEDLLVHEKQALAAMGQTRLMNLYESFFQQVNVPIAQILFGKNDIITPEGHKNLTNTFETLLQWKILPIVNENDSIATEELNLGDNDLLSAMVASLLGADLLVILTSVDGFLRNGKLVEFMESVEDSDFAYALGPSGPGKGGMNTKLRAGKILLNFGITTAIVNGTRLENLDLLFQGKNPGTLIANETTPLILNHTEWKKRFFAE